MTLTDAQTRKIAEACFGILYWDEYEGDRDRTHYEPYTVDEVKSAKSSRLEWIHAHCKRNYSELEDYAYIFYGLADDVKLTELCNELLKQQWRWD